MSGTDDIIEARKAPLSHLSKASAGRALGDYLDWRSGAVAVIVLAVLVVALTWQPDITSTSGTEQIGTPAGGEVLTEGDSPISKQIDQLAPFAQTQHQRARDQAQEALSQFVEKQILLEDTMQVASWGSAELAAAMSLAQTGDAEFLIEHFAKSLGAYQAAAISLDSVIELGNTLFDQHLATGLQHIVTFEADAAIAAVQAALVIKPADTNAQTILQRAQRLPEIIGKLRTAKNHELGGRYKEALTVYADIRQLDPQTSGLEQLKTAAASAQAGDDLTSHISRGFAALDAKQFDGAKRSFNQALKLDPNNDIAKGGLQQVAKDNDLAFIRKFESQADAAMTEENWQTAIGAYQAVLKLDANIQFALIGLREAQAHLRAQRLLTKISAEPQKLSSEKLYLDAVAILNTAKKLERSGPQLTALVAKVDQLLVTYRDPVDVILLSDNATNVTMSNVGQLGFFERKTLSLRPGQYTIRGSQVGCRDIYLSVEVLPGIAPLDLSCPEAL